MDKSLTINDIQHKIAVKNWKIVPKVVYVMNKAKYKFGMERGNMFNKSYPGIFHFCLISAV